MSESTPRILVIIVNYKSADLTVACLHSLKEEIALFPGSRVAVVENCSGDDSLKVIQEAVEDQDWSNWVDVIPADKNEGFAAGNNIALRSHFFNSESRPDFVHFLNPDTEIRPHALKILVDFFSEHEKVGLLGSRSEDADTTPQVCCFRFPSIYDEFASLMRLGIVDRILANKICRIPIPEENIPIDWVSGATLMVRREVLEELGPLDDRYFMYFEETDFIYRARQKGWLCWHIPSSRVIHYVGRSSGVTVREERPKRRPAYWFNSRRRFFLKNFGLLYTLVADLAALTGLALCRLRWFLLRKSPNQDPPYLFLDLLKHSVLLKGGKIEPVRDLDASETASNESLQVPERPLT